MNDHHSEMKSDGAQTSVQNETAPVPGKLHRAKLDDTDQAQQESNDLLMNCVSKLCQSCKLRLR